MAAKTWDKDFRNKAILASIQKLSAEHREDPFQSDESFCVPVRETAGTLLDSRQDISHLPGDWLCLSGTGSHHRLFRRESSRQDATIVDRSRSDLLSFRLLDVFYSR